MPFEARFFLRRMVSLERAKCAEAWSLRANTPFETPHFVVEDALKPDIINLQAYQDTEFSYSHSES